MAAASCQAKDPRGEGGLKRLRTPLFLFGLLVTALWALNPRPQAPPAAPGDCVMIAVASNDWHTNLYLPADAFPADGALRREWPAARWFVVGWGDEGFYRKGPNLSRAVSAMVPPTPTVLHIVALETRPDAYFLDHAVPLAVSTAGLDIIAGDISAELARTASGQPVRLTGGFFPGRSAFYRATSSYHLLRTCNQWTADRLRRAGLPVNAPVSAFAQPLIWQLEWRAPKACPPAPSANPTDPGGHAPRRRSPGNR